MTEQEELLRGIYDGSIPVPLPEFDRTKQEWKSGFGEDCTESGFGGHCTDWDEGWNCCYCDAGHESPKKD